ncbi:MAG: type II toxin-antitoxin system prevent-host-death family antitoxin [Burkholderiaceae bacterium]|jgi:prevent-host-death family protein|nr:type II toxin-antitoxin system prevent-host-death family antitoxin [Burkholderiaceae bacterium]
MEYAQVKTITSTDFLRNVSAAKRIADAGGTVIITDRGQPSIAMIPITEYRRLTQTGKNLLELLHMPEADAYDFDPQPIRMEARDVE